VHRRIHDGRATMTIARGDEAGSEIIDGISWDNAVGRLLLEAQQRGLVMRKLCYWSSMRLAGTSHKTIPLKKAATNANQKESAS
jgi:hypothetical protein